MGADGAGSSEGEVMIKLQIVQQIQSDTRIPFRIVEVVETVDGSRSRLTNKTFVTLEKAQAYLTETEKRYAGRV